MRRKFCASFLASSTFQTLSTTTNCALSSCLCTTYTRYVLLSSFTVDGIITCARILKRRPLRDTTANNAFVRFDTAISKKFEKQLQDFNEDEYRKLEELKELFEFLDDIIPEDDEEDEIPKKRAGKKR